MLISSANLKALLQNNVCEIKFLRKKPKLGFSPYRRMVCTNANKLLFSPDGRITLNYSPPAGPPRFNQMQKNTVVAWDVLMQDYRAIGCESCDLIATIPASEEFWNYFRETLLPMTAGQKTQFMNS